MTTVIIIIGSVLITLGIYQFLKNQKHEDEFTTAHVLPQEEAHPEPVVVEEPVVVVDNKVVEPKTEAPKAAPKKRPARKKPSSPPKAKASKAK